ncbi:ATP-dependent RNA helicase HrpA [Gordonia amarae NBRC 15530]|uniref:ATP-dependent RNA helicase HrpA n=1 Tax=Gordonia amarae NBRC 15530 TaxID=1075090 RepID=G7GVS5_9ACTN|nr:ATP-dependent RNA helicase HrpA [Gordonia amarae NBRC 15530]
MSVGALRQLLPELTVADGFRFRRRLDKLGRNPKPQVLKSIEREIAAAGTRVDARRARTPRIDYPAELPVSAAREEIAAAIEAHQVVVIAGETGSGKTTQLPKICLEAGRGIRGTIGHTQPRRIAASSVAKRIADETGTEIGDAVGYSVRFTDRSGANTLVKVMTDGILLREISTDPMLRAYDTLIIDEAHERSLNIDFILGYLKQLLPRRPDLKVIITSATIEPGRFAQHFAVPDNPDVPIIEVSGRTYPVEVRYRPLTSRDAPDSEHDHADLDQLQGVDAAITELWAHERGDILVFLPTERDIRDTADALKRRAAAGAEIVPLFARLSIADQQKVFSPSDGRRIVLATNVAETSLTVPGIRYVIDVGTARISRYSTRTKVNRLPVEPVSQASARQRAGRCGRVAPGICIRLYSEDDFDSRDAFTDPEILRTNLASVILQMASLRLGDIAEFPFVQAPDARAIRDGLGTLLELAAITETSTGTADEPDTRSLRSRGPQLTEVGRTMARLPVDPRLARMLVEAHTLGCLDHVLVIASALSIPDVRERPADAREAADTAHRRFVGDKSEFLGHLMLWNYLEDKRKELSGNQFRRMCEREFLHFLRIREWRDLHAQLTRIVRDLDWQIPDVEVDPDAVHRSVLSGLLSNIAVRNGDTREYSGARGTTLAIFPGSALAKKPPAFIMAAEILETSRLFAHTVAAVDPLWAERLAGDLVKRVYSEPHWSQRRGAAMAYEKVTLYGVTLVARRRVNYGTIDPVVSRELFIRHALVDGEWTTEHAFFQKNRDLLDAVDDIEQRIRRRDISITEDQLFDFYDARVGADCVSTRHFDTWWKKTRRTRPDLLDLDPAQFATVVPNADKDFPPAWRQGEATLELRYRFDPTAGDDGVTVVIPEPLLTHVRPAGFDWLVPGLRGEVATELIKTLPKHIRKTMAPAGRFADLALSRLKPRSEPLVAGLARELSVITGSTITPADFRPATLPKHLTMNFSVVDGSGREIAAGRSLPELRKTLTTTGAARAPKAPTYTDWTADGIGTLAESTTTTVAGQKVTHFPALLTVPVGPRFGVQVTAAVSAAERDRRHPVAVAALFDHRIPALTPKITAGLDPRGRLSLSQSPYRERDRMVADCTYRAIRDAVAADPAAVSAVRSPDAFERLLTTLSPQVRSAAPEYFSAAIAALREVAPLRGLIDLHAGSAAADDVAEQLDNLIFDGFIAATPLSALRHLPRYLQAAQQRLEALPAGADRDTQGLRSIDRVIEHWNARLAKVPATRRDAVNDAAQWLVEELRVGLFAQRLGTAYPVSEKRIIKAIDALR